MEIYGNPANPIALDEKAATLIAKLSRGCLCEHGFGSFCSVPYDTAWVAMVQKNEQWLFPESFQYLLDTQCQDGGWYSGTNAAQVDIILNTAAALLVFKMHAVEPLNHTPPLDMDRRITKATHFLQHRFEDWDIAASTHVGFEILVPALFELLENEGFRFNIPDHSLLFSLRERKLKNFNPSILYGHQKLTLLHSLEAFVGRLNFDKVSHHKVFGSMMASPASTAAYLMNSSIWDDESESYLRLVLANGHGKGNGSVPSAYPTQLFEFSWVLSTLLLSGFTEEALGVENVKSVASFLETHLLAMNGLSGFAPHIQADADDTAKIILALNLVGRITSPKSLISEFQSKSHFRTYAVESNPSFSANCNILCALLYLPNPLDHLSEIQKATGFVCDLWWKGDSEDKWNVSKQYSMMLLSQALMRLLRLLDLEYLELDYLLAEKIPIILFQILIQTLGSQSQHGHWGNESQEISAYSVLTLAYLQPLPSANTLSNKIQESMAKGRHFLSKTTTFESPSHRIWIEKVSYSSEILSQAYCLAALRLPIDISPWTAKTSDLESIPSQKVESFLKFFSALPLFENEVKWRLRASIIEGYLFSPLLRRSSKSIFTREEREADQYLEYIPLTWTATNNLQAIPLSASFLEEMMMLSMLNFQVDEYLESVVGEQAHKNLEPVKELVLRLCDIPVGHRNRFQKCSKVSLAAKLNGNAPNGHTDHRHIVDRHTLNVDTINRYGPEENDVEGLDRSPTKIRKLNPDTLNLQAIGETLNNFVFYVLDHSHVKRASDYDQSFLRHELCKFLLAHITQLEDNTRFSSQNLPREITASFHGRDVPYYQWVHTTSAEHTSCPYSFAFVLCLTSAGNLDCFPGPHAKYVGQDVCYHLAAMCRQYNDFGSIKRDREEKNLNSINFVEFHGSPEKGIEAAENDFAKEAELKKALFDIAAYERQCLMFAMERVMPLLPARVAEMLKLFVDVTDLYGQVYVARDIGIKSDQS